MRHAASPAPHVLMLTIDAGAGGIQTAIRGYLEGLARLGLATTMAAPSGSPVFDGPLFGAAALPFGAIAQSAFGLGLGGPVVRAVRAADLVIVHNNRLIRPARRLGRPVLAVAHGDKLRSLAAATVIVVISTAFGRQVVANGVSPEAVHYVPHFLPTQVHVRPPSRSPDRQLTIGTAGRFVAKKGFGDFLRAIEAAALDPDRTRVTLAGAGPLEGELRAMAERLPVAVTFPGWVPIAELLDQLDVFCLPSRAEPFGLVLLEAMAAGLPCIAVATNGPSDIIEPDVDGLLVPPADANALAEALQHLALDGELRRRLGAAATAKATGPAFGIERFTEDLGRVVAACLESRPTAAPEASSGW